MINEKDSKKIQLWPVVLTGLIFRFKQYLERDRLAIAVVELGKRDFSIPWSLMEETIFGMISFVFFK